MIDGMGDSRAGRIGLSRVEIDRATPAAKAGDGGTSAKAEAPMNPAAEMAAMGAPVSADKVAAIKAAIAEGRYPVDPEKIAERMIALDLWPGA